MPTFAFTPAEAAKITLALASLRKADLPASYVLQPPPPAPYRPAGRVRRAGDALSVPELPHASAGSAATCRPCPSIASAASCSATTWSTYLLNPGAVRVSVEARMPVFHMLPDEAKTIADYFVDGLPGRRARAVRRALHAGGSAARAGALPPARVRRAATSSDRTGGYVGPGAVEDRHSG